jgi:hypothetical protein
MPKNTFVLLDLFGRSLCHAADCYHAGGLAFALWISALAFLQSGEFVFALWGAGVAFSIASLVLRTVHAAWAEAKREVATLYEAPPATPRKRAKRKPKPRNPKPRPSTKRKANNVKKNKNHR